MFKSPNGGMFFDVSPPKNIISIIIFPLIKRFFILRNRIAVGGCAVINFDAFIAVIVIEIFITVQINYGDIRTFHEAEITAIIKSIPCIRNEKCGKITVHKLLTKRVQAWRSQRNQPGRCLLSICYRYGESVKHPHPPQLQHRLRHKRCQCNLATGHYRLL